MRQTIFLRMKIAARVKDAMMQIAAEAEEQSKKVPEIEKIAIVQYQLSKKDYKELCKENGSPVLKWNGSDVMISGHIPEGSLHIRVDVDYKEDKCQTSLT